MKLTVKSAEELMMLSRRLAGCLQGGDVLELVGDVGAGKTTFTQGLAAALGVTERVQSPTFTISANYDLPDGRRLVHYDFYRLSEPGVMAEELHEVINDESAIIVIEWAGVVEGVLPSQRLTIEIKHVHNEAEREVIVTGHGLRGEHLAKELLS